MAGLMMFQRVAYFKSALEIAGYDLDPNPGRWRNAAA
jgi:hypothetical protein